MDLQHYLSFARSLVLAAEKPVLRSYQSCSVNFKADGSEVTEADLKAEQIMREMIVKIYPSHDILGEEYGGEPKPGSEFRWVLDPIDGTTSFVLGVPTYGTLVALLMNDEPIVGVIHFPSMGETVYAAKGLGCWFESRNARPARLHVASSVRLSDAIISSTGAHNTDIAGDAPAYELTPLIRQAKKFRFVGDCLQYALVCRGKLHAALDTAMKPWDIAAIVPCIEEAGGIVSSIEGRRNGIVFGGSLLASCDASLHARLAGLLTPNVLSSFHHL